MTNNMLQRFRAFFALSVIALSASMLVACGGGGGGGGTSPAPVSGTVSGTAVKGPVTGAMVTAYGISGGAMGAKIASANTDAQGNFSLSMGTYAGPVILQMVGGTYTDEASGSGMSMLSGDVMTAVLPTMTAGATVSGIQVTPLTSMAQTMAQHRAGGMTDANITAANTAVGSYFMVNDITAHGADEPAHRELRRGCEPGSNQLRHDARRHVATGQEPGDEFVLRHGHRHDE